MKSKCSFLYIREVRNKFILGETIAGFAGPFPLTTHSLFIYCHDPNSHHSPLACLGEQF